MTKGRYHLGVWGAILFAGCASGGGGGETDGEDGPNEEGGGPRPCTTLADCDDGDFCNGQEQCVDGGWCEPGTPPECDDWVECTRDGCNAERGRCTYSPDHTLCPAGQMCTWAGCRVGTSCTTSTDCDDAVFCNGLERCDPEFGCQPGEAPRCDDGIACTVDACDRTADGCVSAPNDADCEDGDPCTTDRCSTTEGGCVRTPVDLDLDTFVDIACGGDDCDDRNPSIRPGAPEICDGLDNDCSGLPDEGFACERGSTVECATRCGSIGTGACTAACEPPDALACVPPAEACNEVDDDCDTAIDNGFECRVGATRACTTSCGSAGVQACTATCAWETCVPPAETCNGADDDCDGTTDNGDPAVLCPLPPHATATACTSGACVVAGCETGFGDCDGAVANGCETDLRTNDAHCGSCDAPCATGWRCMAGACAAEGCADGTREGFADAVRYPDIAACGGVFSGWIDEASAAAICSAGWHVCRGSDAVVGLVTGPEATAFPGCFAIDAAHDCSSCFPTCRGSMGACRNCCVSSTNPLDPDMGGMGSGCSNYGAGTSCLSGIRLDASTNTFGCQWDASLAGVVCCRD